MNARATEAKPAFPVDIVFTDSGDRALPAQITSLQREQDGEMTLAVLVSPEVWAQIDEREQFATEHRRRVGKTGPDAFGADAPIEIEATLDHLVAESLGLQHSAASAVLDVMVSAADDTIEATLRSPSAWIARAVTQPIDLPPELADLGSVAEGFRMAPPPD